MKIERLYINNYKSLVDFELVEPNSFSVFVGPNAAGKSNVFEALEFLKYFVNYNGNSDVLFGGASNFLNRKSLSPKDTERIWLKISLAGSHFNLNNDFSYVREPNSSWAYMSSSGTPDDQFFSKKFSRLFIDKGSLTKIRNTSASHLALDASNLEKVLRRILQDETIQEEFVEWLQLLIPEFEDIKIHSDNISGIDTLLIKEQHTDQYFDKSLISDGTYNILALLTAVYQSDEPQFLCIEEPENGLNPYVIRELAGFFRQMCEEKGHIIWLNTHSQSLVDELSPEELILIEKKEGISKAKQFKGFNTHGLKMGEAWLSNALGGGVPW